MLTTRGSIHLKGQHKVGGVKPLDRPKSKVNPTLQTAAMARVLSGRGTSIAVGMKINDVWVMAREAKKVLPALSPIPEQIQLVQNFLRTEISPNFELIDLLGHGIGVHHAGLSDEVRALIEWLA